MYCTAPFALAPIIEQFLLKSLSELTSDYAISVFQMNSIRYLVRYNFDFQNVCVNKFLRCSHSQKAVLTINNNNALW